MKIISRHLTLLLIFLSSASCFAQYYTGQKVFRDRFSEEIKDYNQDTYLKIDNTCSKCNDIIVAIESVGLDQVIRHAYINKGDVYEFEYIPVGTYVCKYMWTDIYGRKHYEKDNKCMQYGYNQIGGYVITLEETTYGNLSQSDISESEFFD